MYYTYLSLTLTLISSFLITSKAKSEFEVLKILDGNETQPDDFKYVVGINCNRQRCRCTGSIIDERFIISAAHCFLEKDLKFFFYPVRIVAGSNDISNYSDPRRVEMNVEKIYVPASFNHTYADDIAVLKLKHSLELKKNNLQKLRLPAKTNSRFGGKKAVLLGFGVAEITYTVLRNGTVIESLNYPNSKLYSADVKIIANEECNDRRIQESNLCGQVIKDKWAKHYGGCSGDSGGPLVYKSKVLIGVFIYSPRTCNERFSTGVYTRIKSHIDFIEKAMRDDTTDMIFKVY